MSSLALSFNDVNFNPVQQNDGQIWLTSAELAMALGYKEVGSVTKIFNRNIDEFSDGMTRTVDISRGGQFDLPENGKNLVKKIRIFSLRGCHLIAMLSSGKFAKQFRKWVLDILDKEVGQPIITPVTEKTTTDDRKKLRQAVNRLVAKVNNKALMDYNDAYSMVNQFMNVEHIDEIAHHDLPKAIAYVHNLIMIANQPAQPRHAPLPPEQWQIGTMANTQSYRYLVSIQNDINTINRRLKHMIDLNVQVNESFMAIG